MNTIKSLLYNIANQQEKVRGNLVTLVNELYKDYSEKDKNVIVEKIIKGLKRY